MATTTQETPISTTQDGAADRASSNSTSKTSNSKTSTPQTNMFSTRYADMGTRIDEYLKHVTYYRQINNNLSPTMQFLKDYFCVDTWRNNDAIVSKLKTVVSGRTATSFNGTAGNAANIAIAANIACRSVNLMAKIQRTLKASSTVLTMASAFDGSAMTGAITSNLRTDTEHYAANVPINLAKTFGQKPSDVDIASDVSLPFLKNLLYLLSFSNILSPIDVDNIVQGHTTTMTAGAVVQSRWWPLSASHANAQPAVNARLITMEDYTKLLIGNLASALGWEPALFGNTIAIVPIRVGDCNTNSVNRAWPLMFMQYPYRYTYNTNVEADNRTPLATNCVNVPFSSTTRIDGAVAQVLFVVVDNMNRGTDFNISVGAVDVTMAANYYDGANVNIGGQLTLGLTIQDMFGCLSRMQQLFPDLRSYRSAVVAASELSYNLHKEDALFDAGVGDTQLFTNDNAGNPYFVVPANYALVAQGLYNNHQGVLTSPMGGVIAQVASVPGNEIITPVYTHSVVGVDHRILCAYASRYYFLSMDSFEIPQTLTDIFALTYKTAYLLYTIVDLSFCDRNFSDAYIYGLNNIPQLALTTRNKIVGSLRAFSNEMRAGVYPNFSNNMSNVNINAIRPATNGVGDNLIRGANRMSFRTLEAVSGKSYVTTQVTVSVKSAIKSILFVDNNNARHQYPQLTSWTFQSDCDSAVDIIKLLHQVNYTSPVNFAIATNTGGILYFQALKVGQIYGDRSLMNAVAIFTGQAASLPQISAIAIPYGSNFVGTDPVTNNKTYPVLTSGIKNVVSPNKGTICEASLYLKNANSYDEYFGANEDTDKENFNTLFGSFTEDGDTLY